MEPLGYHLMFRLRRDQCLAPTPDARRRLARSVLRVARPYRLLAMGWADTHGHAVVVGTREEAGELARRVEIGLQRTLRFTVPFAAAHLEPVWDQRHLRNAFHYVLRQDIRHGVGLDPFAEATTAPDLLGARLEGAWTVEHVRQNLPRVQRREILENLDLPELDGAPIEGATVEEALASAHAALCLDGPDASASRSDARAAPVQAFPSIPAAAWVGHLGVHRTTLPRLRRLALPAGLVRAVRQQVAWRRLRASPSLEAPPDDRATTRAWHSNPASISSNPPDALSARAT